MSIYVVKASGSKEKFNPEKIRRTLLRSGASEETVSWVLKRVKERIYSGITTRELYSTVQKLLEKEPVVAMRYDLKRAIMRLGPSGYPFETFVGEVLREHGYNIRLRQRLEGRCVLHEVDIVASRNTAKKRHTSMVECKYHNSPGTYIDLKEALYTYARFLDLREGRHSFDEAWLACNTRSSSEVIRYAKCVGLKLLCWRYPPKNSLEELIEEKALYPVTILGSVRGRVLQGLAKGNYLLAKDLLRHDFMEIKKRTGLGEAELRKIINEAGEMCYCMGETE
jgi:hypothetical protein